MKAGPGRPKGSPNKINSQLKDMIMTALEAVGGIEYLKAQAAENPKTFLLLLGRVLPMQVSNADGEAFHVEVTEVRRTIVDPQRDNSQS